MNEKQICTWSLALFEKVTHEENFRLSIAAQFNREPIHIRSIAAVVIPSSSPGTEKRQWKDHSGTLWTTPTVRDNARPYRYSLLMVIINEGTNKGAETSHFRLRSALEVTLIT